MRNISGFQPLAKQRILRTERTSYAKRISPLIVNYMLAQTLRILDARVPKRSTYGDRIPLQTQHHTAHTVAFLRREPTTNQKRQRPRRLSGIELAAMNVVLDIFPAQLPLKLAAQSIFLTQSNLVGDDSRDAIRFRSKS